MVAGACETFAAFTVHLRPRPQSSGCAFPIGRGRHDRGANSASAGRNVRLQECAQELIHVPGAVQPYGALVTLDPDTLRVLQATDNCADVLGVTARNLIGTVSASWSAPTPRLFSAPDSRPGPVQRRSHLPPM